MPQGLRTETDKAIGDNALTVKQSTPIDCLSPYPVIMSTISQHWKGIRRVQTSINAVIFCCVCQVAAQYLVEVCLIWQW